jgi:hypothetical protein
LLTQHLLVVASILRSLLHAEFSRQQLFVSPIVDHPTLRHRDQSSLTTGIALRRIFRVQIAGKPPAKLFSHYGRFPPYTFPSRSHYIEELAAINREEAEREERLTPIPSGVCELSEYWLPDDPMLTPEPQPQPQPQPQPPTSPILDDEGSVVIDTCDVELDESDPAEPTKSSSKRSLDLTEFEGSFKRSVTVTSASQQRPLFVLERGEITTRSSVSASGNSFTRYRPRRRRGWASDRTSSIS